MSITQRLLQLALDTSTSRPTVAVLSGEDVQSEWIGPEGLRHHETLLQGIEECLTKAKISLTELSFLSVGVGPGLFTGLRIGIATAKFLADTQNLLCSPVSSLEALAWQGRFLNARRLWALSDAKSHRVYALCFVNGKKIEQEEAIALPPEEICKQFLPEDWLIGEGAELYSSVWPPQVQLAKKETPSHNVHQLSAVSVGMLGKEIFARGDACNPLHLSPTYLKTGQSHL